MKTLLTLLLISCAEVAGAVPLVNDRASNPSSEDSLTVLFWATDSLGTPVAADSLFIAVTGPDGEVTYADTTTVSDPRVETVPFGGVWCYTFRAQVATLTNGGPSGLYHMIVVARAAVSPFGRTLQRAPFQVIGVPLSEQLALIGDGPGAYARMFVAVDTAAGSGLAGVGVTVHNLDQTTLLARGWTDVDGKFAVNLDAGSLLVVATSPGYTFAAYDTVIVESGGIDTLAATLWTPDSPPSPVLCRVWGYVYGITGLKEAGAVVTISLADEAVRFNGVILSPFEVSTTTDSFGYFYLDLIPSPLLDPIDAEYEITIRRADGAILRKQFAAPDAGSWRLTW